MSKKDKWHLDHSTYANSEAEQAKVQSSIQLIQRAQERGRQDAEVGLPSRKGIAQSNFIQTTVQDLINTLRGLHRADEHIEHSISKQERLLHEARIQRDEEYALLKKKQSELRLMQEGIPRVLAYLAIGGALGLGISDALLNQEALRLLMPSYFKSLFVSICLGILIGVSAHIAVLLWKKPASRIERLLIRTSVCLVTGAFFYCLALLRSAYNNLSVQALDESGCGDIMCNADPADALYMLPLSFLFFLGSCSCAHFSPSKQGWIAIFKVRSKQMEVRKQQTLYKSELKKVAEAEDQMDELKQYSYSKAQYAIRLEEDCITLAESAWAEYVQSNLRHRRDKVHPACFDKPFEPRLKTYFYKQNSTPSKSKKS